MTVETSEIPPELIEKEVPSNAVKVMADAVDAGHAPAAVDDAAKPTEIPVTVIHASEFFPEIVVGEKITPAAAPVPPIEQPPEQPRGRGRPKGSPNRPKGPDFSDMQVAPVIPVDYAAMSNQIFALTTGVASAYFGPEWKPRSQEEQDGVVKTLEVYLKSKEVKDIPPGLMLCFVVACYAAPRITEPGTKGKLLQWWQSVKLGWSWFKFKFFGRKTAKFNPVVVDKEPNAEKAS